MKEIRQTCWENVVNFPVKKMETNKIMGQKIGTFTVREKKGKMLKIHKKPLKFMRQKLYFYKNISHI